MITALLGLLPPILAGALHAVIARTLPQSLVLRTLLFLEFACLAALGIGLIAAGFPVTAADWFVAAVLTLSIGFAYMLLFIGVVHDSPTLALVNAISSFGPDGMPISCWAAFVRQHPFVGSRLAALIETGVVREDDGVLLYRGRFSLLLRLSDFYRRLCGTQAVSG